MNLDIERGFWKSGFSSVAGVDEVGRGALAGPLVAAAVAFPVGMEFRTRSALRMRSLVRDSKTMTHGQRVEAADAVGLLAQSVGVGLVTNHEIDLYGLAAGNRIAMERAVSGLQQDPDLLLIDAMVLDHPATQIGFIDGDALVLSIAAASIVAKVARDTMMERFAVEFSRYGFEQHRGYGTAMHLRALDLWGPCELHRRSFSPVRRRVAG